MRRCLNSKKVLIGIISIFYAISEISYLNDLGFNTPFDRACSYILGLCGLFIIICGVAEVIVTNKGNQKGSN